MKTAIRKAVARIDDSIDVWQELQTIGLDAMSIHNGKPLALVITELKTTKRLAIIDPLLFLAVYSDLMIASYLS